jgi:hypothetical protein
MEGLVNLAVLTILISSYLYIVYAQRIVSNVIIKGRCWATCREDQT